MKNISIIGYASAWIATAVAIVVAIIYTKSAWCLWALIFPLSISVTFDAEDEIGLDEKAQNIITKKKEK